MATVWALPPKITVPDPGVKTKAVPFHAAVVDELTFTVLASPSKEPPKRLTLPVNVWVPEPRSSAPPEVPLIVRPPPATFPVKVAVPPLFVMETRAVVEKVPMFWSADPAKATGELPADRVPAFVKLP